MAKLVLPATELSDTSVDRVSLVKRGANRIPFRIIKEDGETMDLYKIARSVFQKADPKPAVVAAVLDRANANYAVASAALVKADINLESDLKKEDEDGLVVLGKSDAPGMVLVKLDDSTFVGVSHLQKAFGEAGVPEFHGYEKNTVPSVNMALDHTVRAIKTEIEKGGKAEDVVAFIKEATGEFASFAETMVKHLPESVMKADALLKGTTQVASMMAPAEGDMDGDEAAAKMPGKKKAPPAQGDTIEVPMQVAKGEQASGQVITQAPAPSDVDDNEDSIEANQKKVTKEEISEKPVEGTKTSENFKHGTVSNGIEESPSEGNPKGKTGTKVQDAKGKTSNNVEGEPGENLGSTTSDTGHMPGGIKKEDIAALLKEAMEPMASSLLRLTKSVKELERGMEETKETARKAEDAVNGFVGAEPSSDRVGMRKTEKESAFIPLLDTAFHRDVA